VQNEECGFEYQTRRISPVVKDATELNSAYRLGLVPNRPENLNGILNVGGVEQLGSMVMLKMNIQTSLTFSITTGSEVSLTCHS